VNVFVIEKNIELPPKRHARGPGRACIYPFAHMQVGDSFVTDRKGAVQAARSWGKRREIKFSARKVQGGTRIWRTA